MKFGFVIDNTRCIGCHACTVACKSEHDVPIGVNRTWVKYIEKGEFPDTKRVFSVMRCNHCEDSPCTDICPTSALYTRTDGIVDFNNERCIGCKACMQACPYDALYIDPETHTAAKCNYCAHRVDVGLEPACVNVCPTQAIISGDMDNPTTTIAKTISRNNVTVRKGEKATKPKLFYIEGDEASLSPISTEISDLSMWGDQKKGVGHHAGKESDGKVAVVGKEFFAQSSGANHTDPNKKSLGMSTDPKRVYDSPSKGILWGWEVAGYIFTKAIAAGIFPIALLLNMLGLTHFSNEVLYSLVVVSLVFLGLTGLLLIKDLDQPKRFLYVLLRPHFSSWLVKGAYIITGYGFFLTLWPALTYLGIGGGMVDMVGVLLMGFAFLTSIYTAFLFSQAKGRDFWQSPLLVFNMFTHTLIGSAGVFIILAIFLKLGGGDMSGLDSTYFSYILIGGIVFHLVMLGAEIYTPHPTTDSKVTFKVITSGRYKNQFLYGMIVVGIVLPIIAFLINVSQMSGGTENFVDLFMATTALIGMWYSIKTWVFAPQTIQLS